MSGKTKYLWWIKERHNPQIGTYYVAYGQRSKTEAKMFERPVYGSNIMHPFKNEADYKKRLDELIKQGQEVQDYP